MWLKLLLLIVAAIIAQHVYHSVVFMGYHKHVYNHRPGPCKYVNGIDYGAEDVVLFEGSLAIVSSGFQTLNGDKHPQLVDKPNRVPSLFDFNNPDAVKHFKIVGNLDLNTFAALGISVWKTADKTFVYIINHPEPYVHTVEKFSVDVKNVVLTHLKTIRSDKFRLINNLIMTGEDSFYITNMLNSESHTWIDLEIKLRLHITNVLYCEVGNCRTVADGYYFLNGINISPDKKFLYVSALGNREIHVFDILPDKNITLRQVVPLYVIADNLDVDAATGDIWAGTVPVLWKTFEHMADIRKTSSAQVLRLKVKDGNVTEITEVYADDGSQLSGSTVAVRYKDAMLVGTIYTKLLYCKLNSLNE